MKKLLLSFIVVSFAGFCFAPIELQDKPVNGYKPPKATESQLQQQQQQQQLKGEVGGVPIKTDENGTPVDPASGSDKGAQGILGSAQNRINPSGEDSQAEQVLTAADENLKAHKEGGGWPSMLLMGFVFLCAGFGVVFGLKHWVGKNVPDVPEAVKQDW